MKQSTLHLAIIMDGNGRWATRRALPRTAGHRAGADAVRRIVEAAPDFGITMLTLYAFSSDNWRRPPEEVGALMKLFRVYLRRETDRCIANGVRFRVIGRRDRLPQGLVEEVERAERETAAGRTLELRIAVDYSSRDAILRAAESLGPRPGLTREAFSHALDAPDVDLLIRTAGEQRLSDFLLWECAYAEFWFTDRLWPDFGRADLDAAFAAFRSRERRYGGLPASASA